jgi:hypothetical protein
LARALFDRSADRVAAVVYSAGTVTRPRYPELISDDAVGVHREWLAEWLWRDQINGV